MSSDDEWTPPEEDRPVFEESLLAEAASLEGLRPFLGPPPAMPGDGGPAYGFARALGLPEYQCRRRTSGTIRRMRGAGAARRSATGRPAPPTPLLPPRV